MAVTIRDVARKAGVSVATVSRSLNNPSSVAEKTNNLIRQAMDELQYIPNQVARSLSHARTGMVGYVIPSLSIPFFAELTQLVEQKLYDAGYHMLLCTTFGSVNRENSIINMLRQHRVDAIVIGSPTLSDNQYHEVGIPIVALDTILPTAAVSIRSDHLLGGRLAAECLIHGGCTNALQIIGNPFAHTDAQLRYQSFLREMSLHGIPCISVPVPEEFDFDSHFYAEEAAKLLDFYPNVDAYFATDSYALAILKCALSRAKRIPEDIQILGYDGSVAATASYPQLTVIRQPYELLSERIVDCVNTLIQGRQTEKEIILDQVQLIQGSTTRRQ